MIFPRTGALLIFVLLLPHSALGTRLLGTTTSSKPNGSGTIAFVDLGSSSESEPVKPAAWTEEVLTELSKFEQTVSDGVKAAETAVAAEESEKTLLLAVLNEAKASHTKTEAILAEGTSLNPEADGFSKGLAAAKTTLKVVHDAEAVDDDARRKKREGALTAAMAGKTSAKAKPENPEVARRMVQRGCPGSPPRCTGGVREPGGGTPVARESAAGSEPGHPHK